MEPIVLKHIGSSRLVIGVDEAGRGPVIGPMVMALVGIEPLKIPRLIEMGVADSKTLTPKTRENLFKFIVDIASIVAYIIAEPKVIDEWVLRGDGLNALEALLASRLLETVPESLQFRVFIDSPSNPKSYSRYLEINGVRNAIVENKADHYRPVVSAASIIAKVVRDQEIKKIKSTIGIDIGSGYPSDPRTKRTLRKVLEEYPQFVRKSWKTLDKL